MNKKRLGKGLGALIPEMKEKEGASDSSEGIVEIALEKIGPNPLQPRRQFDQQKLLELADTIAEHGIIQPVIVRREREKDHFILVAGERRLKAARMAGLKTIPAIIKEYDEARLMEITLIENLQREDLNPIEESHAYRRLIEEFGLKQDELARRLGRSRSAITNSLRLLSLDNEVKGYIAEGKITVGQARPLLSLGAGVEQRSIAQKIVEQNLTARQVEEIVKGIKKSSKKKSTPLSTAAKDENGDGGIEELILKEMEEKIRKCYGTKVKIKAGGKEGKIEFSFFGEEDLDRLVKIFLGEA